jgi:alcohol dehydrogenase (cytochrome c)
MGRRVSLLVILAAAGALVALLATGVLSRTTGGNNSAIPTTPPTVATTSEGTPVTGGTLANPYGPGDWPTYGGSFDQIRHSPLTLINQQNVSQLGRVFSVDFRQIDKGIPKGQESFPIVVNGIIYVTTGDDYVFAVDGGSGKVLWEYKPPQTGLYTNYGVNTNRGVAYCDGKVFLLTLDMHIVSLDASTGGVVKDVPIARDVPGASAELGYSETSAPICYRNILLIGASGSDYGVRGFVMAYHTDLTPAWSNPFWTIPPAGVSWRKAGSFVGGGTSWNPAAIDPETDIAYITVSNPSPIFDPKVRPGPDGRTDSVIALNVFTGRQIWWQQQLAGDQWGYSTSQPVLVFNATVGGKRERVVSVGTKEGEWFMYNARTGVPIYSRVQLVNQEEHPSLVPGKTVTVYPSSLGGLNYSPSSFDPGTGYVINSVAETASTLQEKTNVTALDKKKVQGDVDNGLANGSFGGTPAGWHDYGSVSAVNTSTGAVAWRFITPEPGRGGVTTTASALGFAGGGDGVLRAFDVKTGNVLWSFQTGYQIAAGPTIYEAHGKEYLAITIGGTATSSYGSTASILDVFAIGGNTNQSPAPPLRPQGPGPGLLTQPVEFLSAAPAPHTLNLQVVASLNDPSGSDTLDGTSKGKMIVRVPDGWAINVTFANQSTRNPDGAVVTSVAGDSAPSFSGAATANGSQGVRASGVSYFHFTASQAGAYALSSTVPSRAAAGEWLRVEVVPSDATPELVLDGVTYAVSITSGGGGGGGGLGQ